VETSSETTDAPAAASERTQAAPTPLAPPTTMTFLSIWFSGPSWVVPVPESTPMFCGSAVTDGEDERPWSPLEVVPAAQPQRLLVSRHPFGMSCAVVAGRALAPGDPQPAHAVQRFGLDSKLRGSPVVATSVCSM
jgi:hypothetical protein